MFQRLFLTLWWCFVGLFAGQAVAEAPAQAEMTAKMNAEMVMATVGEVDITLGHMVAMAMSLPEERAETEPDAFFAGVLDRLMQQEAVAQSTAMLSRLDELRLENNRRAILANAQAETLLANIIISDAEIMTEYQARFAALEHETEYNASHILVETLDEAIAMVAELAGGADFAQLARTHSIGPSGPGGGSLGWFGHGVMVPSFEEAIKKLDVGQVSTPVQTEFGWHVIKVNDKRIPSVPDLEIIKEELREELTQKKYMDALVALIEGTPAQRTSLDGLDPAILNLDPSMLAQDPMMAEK